MRPTPILRLAATAALVAGGGWVLLTLGEGRGWYLPPVPWVVYVTFAILIGVVLWSGLRVRAYLRGDRPGLSPLEAARTVVLAKASAVTGAVFVGWYAAQVLVTLGDWGFESRRSAGVGALIAVALAFALAVAGLVVERWCRLSDGDDPGAAVTGAGQVEQ